MSHFALLRINLLGVSILEIGNEKDRKALFLISLTVNSGLEFSLFYIGKCKVQSGFAILEFSY